MKFGRIPIQPLDYKDNIKRIGKELLVNYETGDIYISKADKTLIDITKPIRDKLNNLSSDTIELNIDGIGKITLTNLAIQMIKKIDESIDIIDEGSNSIKYYEKNDLLDGISLESKKQIIQIKDFDIAEPFTIPRKNKDGKLEWVSLLNIVQDGKPQNELPSEVDNKDGLMYTVDEIYAQINKIYLRLDRRQKTINPQEKTLYILLPTDLLDEYGRVDWLLSCGNNVPTLNFQDNVRFEINPNSYPSLMNNTIIYTFETYDFGVNWLCSKKMYPGTYDLPIHEAP